MAIPWIAFLSLLLGVAPLAQAQCPNEVALFNPNVRTMSANQTWFVIPVPSTAVQAALDSVFGPSVVVLADVPRSDTSLFPAGFPADMHPVIASAGFDDDIRQSVLEIDGALLNAVITAPYVRRPNSTAGTLLGAPLSTYLAGPNGQTLPGVVPASVSTLVGGVEVRLGIFEPTDAAYQLNSGGVFSNSLAWNFVPNPASGPGIAPEALDFQYFTTDTLVQTTPKLFKAALNQPEILAGANLAANQCQRNQYYFNNATSTMILRAGNVTFGPAADGATLQTTGILQAASPDGSGFYPNVEGFSACGQAVGNNPQNCDEASADVDPASL